MTVDLFLSADGAADGAEVGVGVGTGATPDVGAGPWPGEWRGALLVEISRLDLCWCMDKRGAGAIRSVGVVTW